MAQTYNHTAFRDYQEEKYEMYYYAKGEWCRIAGDQSPERMKTCNTIKDMVFRSAVFSKKIIISISRNTNLIKVRVENHKHPYGPNKNISLWFDYMDPEEIPHNFEEVWTHKATRSYFETYGIDPDLINKPTPWYKKLIDRMFISAQF